MKIDIPDEEAVKITIGLLVSDYPWVNGDPEYPGLADAIKTVLEYYMFEEDYKELFSE